MFKALRWAFKMGVRQERMRIEMYLTRELEGLRYNEFGGRAGMNGDERDAVTERAKSIAYEVVNRVFETRWQQEKPTSVMHPNSKGDFDV